MRKFFLFFGDILILYIALILTLFIRYGNSAQDNGIITIHFLPFSILFFIWTLVSYITNLYELSTAKNNVTFYSNLLSTFIVNVLISILFFYFVPFFKITPKLNLMIFIALSFGLIFLWRYYCNILLAKHGSKNNTLIIGDDGQSQDLFALLKKNPQIGYNVVGIVGLTDEEKLRTLKEIIIKNQVKTLILSPAVYKIPAIIDLFYQCIPLKIRFFQLSDFFEKITGKIPLEAIDQAWFLENLSDDSHRLYDIGKRFIDIVLTIVVGIITLPLFPFIILAIKLDSAGSAFYRQRRIGKSGVVFNLVKFRTMPENIEHQTGAVWASEKDTRTTRFGKFLRKTRMDELPQIWNVFRGSMSFIGPRPERPEFHSSLKQQIPFYEERYLVKPGLTGWAQIKYKLDFKGGMTVQDTAEKVKFDLYYIKNRSILLDIGITLKTISIILKKVIS